MSLKRPGLAARSWSPRNTSTRPPTIAPAGRRSSAPRPRPSSATPTPASTRPSSARAVPGTARSSAGASAARAGTVATHDATSASTPVTSAATIVTTTWASSTGSRRGTAVNVVRAVPVVWSAVATSTPSTRNPSCASTNPDVTTHEPDRPSSGRTNSPSPYATAAAAATVPSTSQPFVRRLVNRVVSERSTRGNVGPRRTGAPRTAPPSARRPVASVVIARPAAAAAAPPRAAARPPTRRARGRRRRGRGPARPASGRTTRGRS